MDKAWQGFLLKTMLRIRRMEELCAELYTQEKIRGFLHLYIGEEAVASGVMAHVRRQDNVIATYREHGHALLKGIPASAIMAEMFGKLDGCSRGRGGSMHLFSREHRFFGGNAIVGGGIPQAVGLALAAKQLGEDRLTFCFFGEGAMAEGVFHESANLAALWRLPVVFCCENNRYAMGTALARSESQTSMAAKARAYNIEALEVDGMDGDGLLRQGRTRRGMRACSGPDRSSWSSIPTDSGRTRCSIRSFTATRPRWMHGKSTARSPRSRPGCWQRAPSAKRR